MSRGLDVRPVFAHPLFLVTMIMAVAGWFTAFIGQAVTEAKYHSLEGSHGSAVGVPWFGIFLELFLIIAIFITLGTDSAAVHRFQISIFLAIAVVFAVLGVNQGIFGDSSYVLAIGAGWLILAIVNIVWLLYFSSEEDAFFMRLLSLGSGPAFSRNRRVMNGGAGSVGGRGSAMGGSNVSASGGIGYNAYTGVGQKGAMSVGDLSSHHGGDESTPGATNVRSPTIGGQSLVETQQAEYILKAKALYSYSASPDDPNEISFTKGDLLDILDNSGKWWQARKTDGTKGIVPSNYLSLL